MKITPVTAPPPLAPTNPQNSEKRTRAIEAFNKGQSSYDAPKAPVAEQSSTPKSQSQEHPVINPDKISAEEMSAVVAPTPAQAPEVIDEKADVQVEEKVEPKKEDTLSRQFAQLARQERALRQKVQQQEQAIKAREEALKAREAELVVKDNQYKTGYISVDRFKADPLAVMAETGLSYDELTQQLLNHQPTDPRLQATISRLESKIKQLEESAETAQKSYAEQQQQAYQSAVKQIEIDARNLVKNDPNFETIKATGSIKDVVELITETYNKDGVLLSVEEAAQEVENYLVEEAMKVTRIGKIKKRLEESNASTKQAPQKTQATPKQPQTMKTLTNATSSTRKLSAKERAILAFKGELKP